MKHFSFQSLFIAIYSGSAILFPFYLSAERPDERGAA
jgi:hypothetical protein